MGIVNPQEAQKVITNPNQSVSINTGETITVGDKLPAIANLSKILKSLDEKTILIQRQGCIQAVVQSQAVFSHTTNLDEWFGLCGKIADKMIDYINKV